MQKLGPDFVIEYSDPSHWKDGHKEWIQIRIARLLAPESAKVVQVGAYTCSPIDEGYKVTFHSLNVQVSAPKASK